MKTFALVIATIRDVGFLGEWDRHLGGDTTVYIVEDREEKTVQIPEVRQKVVHLCHEDIDRDLGKDSWIIPRKTSGIKSYGILKAWRDGHEGIAILDDDCFPSESSPHWETDHKRILNSYAVVGQGVFNTVFGFYPRGYPFGPRERESKIVLSVGGWEQYPDIDAKTELTKGVPGIWWMTDAIVPYGQYFPLCGMNIAFRREIAPLMYFGLQGKGYEFDRYDDIWMGIFAKAVIDGMGQAIHVGRPIVRHSRASDPRENLKKETAGYPVTERMVEENFFRPLPCRSWTEGMFRVSMRTNALHDETGYFEKLGRAMRIWNEQFIERV